MKVGKRRSNGKSRVVQKKASGGLLWDNCGGLLLPVYSPKQTYKNIGIS